MVVSVTLAVAASMGFLRPGIGRMSLVFAGLVGAWHMGRVRPVVLRGMVGAGMRVHIIEDGVVSPILHFNFGNPRIYLAVHLYL